MTTPESMTGCQAAYGAPDVDDTPVRETRVPLAAWKVKVHPLTAPEPAARAVIRLDVYLPVECDPASPASSRGLLRAQHVLPELLAVRGVVSREGELVCLQVLALQRSTESQTEAILELHRAGFSQTRIADLVGTSAGTVKVAIQRAKKKFNTSWRRRRRSCLMATGSSANEGVVSAGGAMAGILALLAAEREDRLSGTPTDKQRRTELVLADAGLAAFEIGRVLNKNPHRGRAPPEPGPDPFPGARNNRVGRKGPAHTLDRPRPLGMTCCFSL